MDFTDWLLNYEWKNWLYQLTIKRRIEKKIYYTDSLFSRLVVSLYRLIIFLGAESCVAQQRKKKRLPTFYCEFRLKNVETFFLSSVSKIIVFVR